MKFKSLRIEGIFSENAIAHSHVMEIASIGKLNYCNNATC